MRNKTNISIDSLKYEAKVPFAVNHLPQRKSLFPQEANLQAPTKDLQETKDNKKKAQKEGNRPKSGSNKMKEIKWFICLIKNHKVLSQLAQKRITG